MPLLLNERTPRLWQRQQQPQLAVAG
jgi:hypothetical protein